MPNLDTLKQAGYKLTPPRQKICEQIEKLDGIFCAKQIIKKLTKIDRVSVYRNLELLEKLKLIRPAINIKGEQFYEKNNETHHHHHIVCTECMETECVDCTEPKIKQTKKFTNLNHLLIFTGICHKCS
ncbi:MAG: transcriptional repressor [Candidatus Magasanikiibacteriota bacterium]